MRCPHCRAESGRHRPRSGGAQCPECRRLFVVERPLRYAAFSDAFLRQRVVELTGDAAFLVTSLQVQRDLKRQRPYPVPPALWYRWDLDNPPQPAMAAGLGVIGAGGYLLFTWWDGLPVGWFLGVGLLVALLSGGRVFVWIGFVVALPFRVVAACGRLLARLVRRWGPDRRRVVLTRSAFTARVRAVAPEVVDEHGMAPPPAPDPVRFAVLCPDPGMAACLWANGVADHLGALVVTAMDDVPRGLPVLDLTHAAPAAPPADLVSAVLRFAADHVDAGRTGFLAWPVTG